MHMFGPLKKNNKTLARKVDVCASLKIFTNPREIEPSRLIRGGGKKGKERLRKGNRGPQISRTQGGKKLEIQKKNNIDQQERGSVCLRRASTPTIHNFAGTDASDYTKPSSEASAVLADLQGGKLYKRAQVRNCVERSRAIKPSQESQEMKDEFQVCVHRQT